MAVYSACSHCGSSHTLEDRFAGKTIKCKECGEAFNVDEGTKPQAKGNPRQSDREAIQSPSRPVPPPPPRSAPSRNRRDDEDDRPARRRVVDEDDDRDDAPRRRSRRDEAKSSTGLILACAGGGIVVLGLVAGLVW